MNVTNVFDMIYMINKMYWEILLILSNSKESPHSHSYRPQAGIFCGMS